MGLFDNKNLNINLPTEGLTITRDKKGRIKEIDINERDKTMAQIILGGIGTILTVILSKDKK